MAQPQNKASKATNVTLTNKASKGTTMAATVAATAKATVAPAALALPAASIALAPAKSKTTVMAGAVGQTYGVACTPVQGQGAAGMANAIVLPFALPAWAGAKGAPVTMVVASTGPNWLGRNGHPLLCTVYASPLGTVTVQPHAKGVQVNAHPHSMPGAGIAVHSMAPVAKPAAAPLPTTAS
tara:strand:+ start:4293 stop:4838 length:546 start_codon:yes stop_codon:yes gene_type:complete